jgi:adenine-specific DNA-methyltransferase
MWLHKIKTLEKPNQFTGGHMQKLNGETLNIVDTNIEKLKELFPDVFSEGKIDFEALKTNLGEFVEKENERYSFSWNGKEKAKKIALTPSTGTLRPCKDESKNWETTENLYIEGDNLEVLKLLQKSYFEKVKMIYIDPPYNTGKDFVYKDNFNDNLKNYMEVTGQLGEEGERLSTNSDQSGRYHSNWLNMMYPRLKLARNLLKDDGVIFISIDDNEVVNLRKLCNDIFLEDNFIACFVWQKNFAPKNDNKYISISHEYILCFAKKKEYFDRNLLPREDKHNIGYNNPDNDSRGVWTSGSILATSFSVKGVFEIKSPIGYSHFPPEGRCWRYSQDKIDELLKDNRLWFGKDGKGVPRVKRFLTEMPNGVVPQSWLKYEDVGSGQDGTQTLKQLLDNAQIFDFPKPIELIKKFIQISSKNNDIILDFFSGSSTTAHAVIESNIKENGNRKFIMVQLPELTSNKLYPTICEIGKERIRRAGEKIKEDFLKENEKIKLGEEPKEFKTDIGFKVFKLDSSNIKAWDSEYAKDNIQKSLLDSINNIKEDRTELDLLFELLLKQGLDLTTPIIENKVNDKPIYNIGAGALYVSLSDGISVDVAEKIIEENKIYQSPRVTVIFKDNGFANDVDKTNVIQTLKVAGITDIKSI